MKLHLWEPHINRPHCLFVSTKNETVASTSNEFAKLTTCFTPQCRTNNDFFLKSERIFTSLFGSRTVTDKNESITNSFNFHYLFYSSLISILLKDLFKPTKMNRSPFSYTRLTFICFVLTLRLLTKIVMFSHLLTIFRIG